MKDFSKFLLISDLDGTLVNRELNVNDNDLKALNEFTQGGGLFTLATGRSEPSCRRCLGVLPINLPAVLANGGCVFDFNKNKAIYEVFVPENTRETLDKICKRFPKLRAAVIAADKYFDVTYVDDGSTPFIMDAVTPIPADLQTLEYPWYKVLCNICDHEMSEVMEFAESLNASGISYVQSTPFYFELMPSNIDKYEGIKKLIELENIKDRTIVCIGDYFNDLEMIEKADIGVTLSDAPDEVKRVADIIVGTQKEDPIAQLIQRLKAIV